MTLIKNLFLFVLVAGTLFMTSCGDDTTTDPPPVDENPDEVVAAAFADNGNQVANPDFATGTITPAADLGTTSSAPAGMENTSYKGAVNPSGTPWYEGWSSYGNILNGGNTNAHSVFVPTVITDADMMAAGNVVNWTKDKTYLLDGFVFVSEGQTLNIEAGTIIQAKPGEGADASALIVARGGKIMANGTATEPIVFTAEGDLGGSNPALRGQWGGIIILGYASINTTEGVGQIEGIPSTEERGKYGGGSNVNDADNSGVLNYVSIRHGGTLIGGDNEINGLTLGGVGSGTTISYVEVVGNLDDGIEWFGGTVNGDHLIVVFCGDDALDYDEGYRGNNQFVIVHQDPAIDGADRGGEHDGGTDPEDGTPYATPKFYNVTSIGNPDSRAITFRDNAGGEYHNSIFSGYAKGVDIEYLTEVEQDSYQMMKNGLLNLSNNVFHNIGAGTEAADLFKSNTPE